MASGSSHGQVGMARPEDIAALRGRTDAFLGKSKGERVRNLVKQGRANQEIMKALDNSLQGFGLSLERFKAPGALSPLDPAKERRYFVPAEELPGDMRADLGFAQRSCVETLASGASRLETGWIGERRLLIEVADCGSIGMPARHYLYSSAVGLRGWVMPDPHTFGGTITKPQFAMQG